MTTENSEQNDERLRPNLSEDRESRAMTDRAVTESKELSDDERIEMFRMQHFQNVLPDLPRIPGYHVCWLSTTSQTDTIIRRETLGYSPVKREDIPGWDYDKSSLKTGEHAGLIGINEMLAYKISDKLYQAYMTEAHFNAPNDEDDKLRVSIEELEEMARANKSRIDRFDGTEEFMKNRNTTKPTFE